MPAGYSTLLISSNATRSDRCEIHRVNACYSNNFVAGLTSYFICVLSHCTSPMLQRCIRKRFDEVRIYLLTYFINCASARRNADSFCKFTVDLQKTVKKFANGVAIPMQ